MTTGYKQSTTDLEQIFATKGSLNASSNLWAAGDVATKLGNNPNNVLQRVPGTKAINKVAGGSDYVMAVATDGTLWGCGGNAFGQIDGNFSAFGVSFLTQIGTLSNWSTFSCGNFFNLSVKTDGSLWAWGDNAYGQLGQGNVSASVGSPVQVGALTTWRDAKCTSTASIAIKTDGTLWSWGYNTNGELGLGNVVHRSSPVQIGALTTWQSISTSYYSVAAIKTDGTLWMWGYNAVGNLGRGDLVYRSSPVQVGALTNWKQVAGGAYFTAAIKTDGTLWTWGDNQSGQLGHGDVVRRSSPVQVGSLTDWKYIGTGAHHVVAIKTDGTLWAWGSNSSPNSPLGLGDNVHRSSPVQVGSLSNWKTVMHDPTGFTTCAVLY